MILKIISTITGLIALVFWVMYFSNGTLESYIISCTIGWTNGYLLGDLIFEGLEK